MVFAATLREGREAGGGRMIKGVIIINNHGKPRLVKFYQSVVSPALQH
jgi:hypothetical protein